MSLGQQFRSLCLSWLYSPVLPRVFIHQERWHLGEAACRPWPWRSLCPSLFWVGDVNQQGWQMSQQCVSAIVGSSYCFPSHALVNHLFELNVPALVNLSLQFHLCQLHGEREVCLLAVWGLCPSFEKSTPWAEGSEWQNTVWETDPKHL